MSAIDDLNLELAWRKTKRDFNHHMNSFVRTPYVLDILDSNTDVWMSNLKQSLKDDRYSPRTSRFVDIPKSDYHLRPGCVLHPFDVVVYSSYVLKIYDSIQNAIDWSSENHRYSHILPEDISSTNRWEKFEKDHWKTMHKKKIELCDEYDYVLETDISGYYENIDIERLISIIKQILEEKEREKLADRIWDLLAPWADPRKRGIPQGYGPSDLLAELYLDGIDKRLDNHQFTHIRYNDDFTVFCDSRDEIIQAQNLLERQFRARGLNMKTGKTSIKESDEALRSFTEIEDSFEELRTSLEDSKKDDEEYQIIQTPYGSAEIKVEKKSEDAQDDISSDEGEYSEEVLEKAFSKHIEDEFFTDIDIHFFRYIINKLGNTNNNCAVEYCIKYIQEGCPEVRRILYDYFEDLENKDLIASNLAKKVANGEIRYPYHTYCILRWFFEEEFDSEPVLHSARVTLQKENNLLEARDYAVAILGDFGDYSDLEHIELVYSEELRPQSKAVFAYAVRNFEPRHRGNFYDRINTSSELVKLAVECAKRDS